MRNFSLTDKFIFVPFSATYKTEMKVLAKLDGRKTNVWCETLRIIGEYKTDPRSP